MKHTGEEWKVKEAETEQGWREFRIMCGTECIATVNDLGSDREEEAKGNCALIKNAPAILKHLDTCSKLSWWSENSKPGPVEMEQRLRSILNETRSVFAIMKEES
jgi:hypothetical protein